MNTRLAAFLSFNFLIFLFVLTGCGNNHEGAIEASGTLEAVEVNIASKIAGQLLSLRVEEEQQWNKATHWQLSIMKCYYFNCGKRRQVSICGSAVSIIIERARQKISMPAKKWCGRQNRLSTVPSRISPEWKNYIRRMRFKKQYEDAESRFTITQAQYNLQNKIFKSCRSLPPWRSPCCQARVEQAKAQASLIGKQISDSYIIAPVGGTITYNRGRRRVDRSGMVIVRIARLEKWNWWFMWTKLNWEYKAWFNADVVIDTDREKNYPRRSSIFHPLQSLLPQCADERWTTKLVFGVKLQVENPNGELKTGMPADAYVKWKIKNEKVKVWMHLRSRV